MGIVLSVQLSVFSNKKVSPSTDNIAIMMTEFKELTGKDYLPSIINTQRIDTSTGNVENIPNLTFSTIDKSSGVVCTEGRIDSNINFKIDQQDNIDAGFDNSMKILKFIMEKLNVFANRLALNVNFISNICNGTSRFENQVMNVVPFYQNKEIKEWSSRTNAKGSIYVDGKEEELNIITDYNHVTNNGETRIVCHSDINTVVENKDYRFTFSSIEAFTNQAKDIFEDIKSDLEEMVK